jgi:hypothetical protein
VAQVIERHPAALADPDEGLSAESQQSARLDRLAEQSARIRPYSTDALTIAFICLSAATALRFMSSWTNSDFLFATYFPAILAAGLLAGIPAAVGFCNPGAARLGLRTRRQSAVQTATRFPEGANFVGRSK